MTSHELEIKMLSLRSWLVGCVLPSAIVLLLTLGAFRLVTPDRTILDNNSVIVGFFILYFVLIRGGHLIMIRSLHEDLKIKYADAYEARLRTLPKNFRRRNLGFTLARIKRDLMTERKF